MKAWIVYHSAFALQCGGLERVFIHFSKPEYFLIELSDKDRDLPFGDISIQEGLYKKYGWQSNHKTWVRNLSIGNWIGYECKLSLFIWDKIKEHFYNLDFNTWDDLEKAKIVLPQNFCLELNLDIQWTTDKNK